MNNIYQQYHQMIDRQIQRKSYEMNKILYKYSQMLAIFDNLSEIFLECVYKFHYQLSMNSLKRVNFDF